MAKTKNKPSVTKEKVSKDKEIKKSKKEEPVTEAVSEPVSESVKATKPKAKAKEKVVKEISIETKIYGDEPVKVVVPFPNSDLQTQTKKIITDFRIDATRLPENVVVAINDMVTDFSTFVTNPNMFNLVSVIMEKDTTAFNLIKDWSDSRQELLIQNKNEKEKNEQNFPTDAQPTTAPLHTQTAFTPLTPSVLPKIAPVIDKQKIHKDYCVSIFSLIQNCFQMVHWKYIPLSELQTLIGNCDKQYKYEIVNQGDNSYVVVSTDSLTEKTNTFSIR